MFHGAVTAFLVDNGATIAASTVMRPGQATLTAEYKVSTFCCPPSAKAHLPCQGE
jgi:hypothetical protein